MKMNQITAQEALLLHQSSMQSFYSEDPDRFVPVLSDHDKARKIIDKYLDDKESSFYFYNNYLSSLIALKAYKASGYIALMLWDKKSNNDVLGTCDMGPDDNYVIIVNTKYSMEDQATPEKIICETVIEDTVDIKLNISSSAIKKLTDKRIGISGTYTFLYLEEKIEIEHILEAAESFSTILALISNDMKNNSIRKYSVSQIAISHEKMTIKVIVKKQDK
jgi:hypothetical protein